MKVLVTGADGFVGSNLMRLLDAAGLEAVGAVRGRKRETGEGRRPLVLLTDVLGGSYPKTDVIVHCAGVAHRGAGAGLVAERDFDEGNRVLTELLSEVVLKSDTRGLIHLSSIAAAGYTEFTSERGLDECGQGDPVSSYGKSKRAAEGAVFRLSESGRLGVNLRPPLIYGRGARGNWPKLVRIAGLNLPLPFRSVRNRRSYLGIDNLAQMVLSVIGCLGRPEVSGTYHVADADVVSLSDVVTALREGMGKSPSLFPFPPNILRLTLDAFGMRSVGDGLFGDLVLDSRLFGNTFSYSSGFPTLEGMRRIAEEMKEGSSR